MINQPRLSSPILVNFKSINPTASSLSESVILHYSYGFFIQCLFIQFVVLKLLLINLVNKDYQHAFFIMRDISLWFQEFLAQALLINMHKYFAGQITFFCIQHVMLFIFRSFSIQECRREYLIFGIYISNNYY